MMQDSCMPTASNVRLVSIIDTSSQTIIPILIIPHFMNYSYSQCNNDSTFHVSYRTWALFEIFSSNKDAIIRIQQIKTN